MAPPVKQKYLVTVDRSEIKTIKFKNGFPPKRIKSRKSPDNDSKSAPHQRVQLMECRPRLKSSSPNALMRKTSSYRKDTSEQNPSAQSVPHEKRVGFAPSAVKQSKSTHQRLQKAPFSPPPTLSELKSLTKKIGRFYTVKNSTTPVAFTDVGNKQRAVLDIEKALSEKDLRSLENCYKRIFNGNVDPIRTIVRNQSYPNQRSRQAMCPVVMHGRASSTRSSPVWLKNAPSDACQERRWSVDCTEERLPIVPAPYFRHENSVPNRAVKIAGEGPVMFSSTRQDYKEKVSNPPSSTVVINLDPERFPEPTARSPQLERTNQNGPSARTNTSKSIKKPIVFKSPAQWSQRAPTSTPEPYLRNEMLIGSGQQRDLLPHVFPAHFRYNSEQRSANSKQINSKTQGRLSKNLFDTREVSTETQSSEVSSVHIEITDGALTERQRVLTSAEDNDTDCDYNEPTVYSSALNKRAGKQELTSGENSSISSEDINQKVEKLLEDTSPQRPDSEISVRETEEISDLARESSMVENINLQKLEINSVCSSNSETGGSIVNMKSGRFQDSSLVDSRKSSSDTHPTPRIEMNDHTGSHMEIVNIVTVNVTTDDGKDINADIFEYEKGKQQEQFDIGMESPEEVSKENGQPAIRNRKDELEALLKEHSSIVEEVKNLSENFDV